MIHAIDPRPITGFGVGDTVIYQGTFDAQVQWGGCGDPRKCLIEGNEYEVSGIEVHDYHTKIALKGYEGKKFPAPAFKAKDGIMDKGKNFSRNRPRDERAEVDFYQTPLCLTQAIVDRHIKVYWEPEREEKTICDYCSGAGAIVKVLHDSGFRVLFGDIKDPIKTDFFNIGSGDEYGLMNPPFRLFNQWVEHCFKVFSVSFALLAPTTYLQGIKRYNKKHQDGIFQNQAYPLTHIYTFNRYPMLSDELRPDGLIETGMQALSWFVWTKRGEAAGYTGDTIHRWLDIDAFVLRKERR